MAAAAGGGNAPQSAGTSLVGRDAAIGALMAAVNAAMTGAGSIVLLSGEAGIGKTSVMRHVVDQVPHELSVTWGKCVADASAPPLWPWSELVASQPRSGDDPDQTVGVARFEHLIDLRDQVLERTRRGPRLHVIEDLQWADVASVLLIVHLAATRDVPLLIVATLRTGEPVPPGLADALEEVRRLALVHELPPLDQVAVGALMWEVGIDPVDDLTARVLTRTGGNPLFVTELLRAVRVAEPPEGRARALSETLPSRIADLVARRVARLPEPVADAVAVASVIGAEGDARTLALAMTAPVESAIELLDQARAAHLIDISRTGQWHFRHELIREAIYENIGPTLRSQHHARVLEVLAAAPSAPPPLVAHHALAAQPIVDPERAVALAARAGESAFAHHAYEDAVVWFTGALSAAPSSTSPRWRAELLVLLGEAHRHTGSIGPAREAFVEASALTDDPALLARAALGYADPGADLGIAFRSEDPVTAATLESAIAAQPSSDSVSTVLLETRLAAELYFSADPGRARTLSRTAVNRARRIGDLRALTAATAVAHDAFAVGQAPLDDQLAESAEMLEWARVSGSVSALLTAHRARVFDLLAAGDTVAMDEEIVNFQRLAGPMRIPGFTWWTELWSAMRALLEGRHDDAEERAVAAFQIGAGPFPGLAFSNLSFLLFFLRREQGRLPEMEGATRDYARSHADIPALRVALAFLLAELGRLDESGGLLASLDDAALDRLGDRNWPASWFQLARAAHLVGDRPLAMRLLTPERRPTERCVIVSLATVCLGATDLAAAWLRDTLGEYDAADAAYARAEDLNARVGARSWLAQARSDHAALLRGRNRPGDREEAGHLEVLASEAARTIGLVTVTGAALRDASVASFRRDGAVWDLVFGDRAARLADSRGLHDLAYLLSQPGEAVSVMELAGQGRATFDESRGAEVFDERARRAIRDRLRALDEAEADADASGDNERAAAARASRQELAEAVARDFGLGGRSRRVGDTVERARKTVSTRIRRAIAAVGLVHPELGRHLERSVDTGAWCAYRPAEPVDWSL